MFTFTQITYEAREYTKYEKGTSINDFDDNWIGMLSTLGVCRSYRSHKDYDRKELNSFSCYFPSKNTAKGVKSDPPLYRRPVNPEIYNDEVKASAEWAQRNMSIPSGKNNYSEG